MASKKKTTKKAKESQPKQRKSRKGVPSPNKGKSLVNFKDIQILYMSEGIDGVRGKHESIEGGLSKPVLWAAINNMPGATDTEALRAFAVEVHGEPSTGSGRGRSAPTVGTGRVYKAQQVKDGGCFLRLPLETLGVKKGQPVATRFEDGQIVVNLNFDGIDQGEGSAEEA